MAKPPPMPVPLADIANYQITFLQKTLLDALAELQDLSRARNPAEFAELGIDLTLRQTERSVQAFGDLHAGILQCWVDAFTTPADQEPEPAPPPAKSQA